MRDHLHMRGGTRPSGGHHGEMTEQDRLRMLAIHHGETLWVYWLLILAGIWMIAAPFTFGYSYAAAQPSGGREVWLSLAARASAMQFSDVLSGLLLVAFGWRSLTPNRPFSLWVCCLVGVWLNLAPLVFWAPTAAGYLNSTLMGILVIALAILIPGMPNMLMFMQMGPETPPGWSYNPSSWPQRWILIVLAFAGFLVSRFLTSYQLGYINSVWEPFFGPGSIRVLNSDLSHAWPISDAGLGTLAYTFEFLMGFMGGTQRWRTMPWMVTFFGILVIPLGLTHIFLVSSQPVVVGEWCTLCLLAAAVMLPMIPLQADEVVAMGQFLYRARRGGQSLWRAFWLGGTTEGGGPDERSPEMLDFPHHPVRILGASIWGMSFPWTLTLAGFLGLWLMFAPEVLGSTGWAASLDQLGGALVITFSVIAMAEVLRAGRFLMVLIGIAILVGPWLVGGATTASQANSLIAGVVIIVLAMPRGPQKERYSSWDRYIF